MTSATASKPAVRKRKHVVSGEARSINESNRVYIVSLAGHGLPNSRSTSKATLRLRSKRALVEQFRAASRDAVWVAPDSASIAPLASQAPTSRGQQRLLVLDEMKEVTHHLFSALFRYVVSASDHLKLLKFDELIEVLSSENRRDLFIGGAVDKDRAAVLLYRGNVEPLVVPLSWFENKASGTVADEEAFTVTDYGQTVKLGAFEAASDAILYEFDPDFRREARKRELSTDTSLGAAIRRLRLQKGLARDAFPGISEKALARIERNEIERPRSKTLDAIAAVLGVPTEQLASY